MKVADIIRSVTDMEIELVILGDEILVRRAASTPLNPECVKPFLKALKQHKTAAIAYLRQMQSRLQDHLSCNSCPWCLDNPWTDYPELPKWCGWWWDHLLADNPQCRDRREGRVPEPDEDAWLRLGRASPAPKKPKPTKGEAGVRPAATCYDCAHFQPADHSPNPTQAWGRCHRLAQGRYGVARVCDAFAPPRRATHARP